MKRSRMLTLLLMGSLGVGGCGSDSEKEETYTFTSLDECVRSTAFSEAECRDLAATAVAETPRFASREECEAQFGKDACQDAGGETPGAVSQNGTTTIIQQHSGGMWMPMMMGFMAGRFMGGGSMMRGSQGLYRDPAAPGTFRTAGGESVRPDASGRVKPTQSMTRAMSYRAKPVMSRSGVGRSGGFFGGSRFGGGAS